MTGTELDEILATEETPVVEQTQEQQVVTEPTQERDDQGRFAKAETQPNAEQPQGQQVEQPEGQLQEQPEDGTVPQQALHASRQREREAKQEAEALRNQLAELKGQVDILSRQSSVRQQPKPEPREAPDWFTDPDARSSFERETIQGGFEDRFEQFSQRMAVRDYGKEAVDAAYAELSRAVQSGDYSAQAEHRRIMADAHPYGALVEWHQQRQTLARVGSDPNAFFESEFERRMAEDPEFMKKVAEKVTGVAQQNSRANPQTQLPPSLNRLPAGGNTPQEADTSDAGLFSHALA